MTRQQFLDEVNSWEELIDFCNDAGCRYCEDICNESERDDCIDENLVSMAREHSWQELFDILDGIPSGYNYYRYSEDYNEWIGMVESDFYERKDDVLEWGDINCIWEEDEDDTFPFEDNDDDFEEDDDFVIDDEPTSIDELMSVCSSQLQRIKSDKKSEEAADDEAFKKLVLDFNF